MSFSIAYIRGFVVVNKKKLIDVDNDLWHLLGIYAKWKNVKIPEALEEILLETLAPLKKVLEDLSNEK